MNNLIVLGKQNVNGMEFIGIEGGFGENCKSMLVKDIATIHGRDVKDVNKLINNNKNRFKESVDIIDLKQVLSNNLFSEYGFTKAQWGNSNFIYLLSERGYAKLLKIMDDDLSWEKYDELVDGYFNMRKQLNVPSYQIEDPIERCKVWIKEYEEKKVIEDRKDYLEQVVIEYIEEIPVAEIRPCIRKIISKHSKVKGYSAMWKELYKEFYYRYKKNLCVKTDNYNNAHETNLSVLEYAEKFGYIKDIYKLALELFEDIIVDSNDKLISVKYEE